jgi:hypothetical protein
MSKYITATGTINAAAIIADAATDPEAVVRSINGDDRKASRIATDVRIARGIIFVALETANEALPKASRKSLDDVHAAVGGTMNKSDRAHYRALHRLVAVHGIDSLDAYPAPAGKDGKPGKGLLERFASSALRSGKGAAARAYIMDTEPADFTVEGLEAALLVQPDAAVRTDLEKLEAALKVIGDLLPMLSEEDLQYAADSLSSLANDARGLLSPVATTVAA